MTKRKSGWYRVQVSMHGAHELAEYYKISETWQLKGTEREYVDSQFYFIDPQMVMTLSGELVYHRNEHDQLYNTKHEG